MTARSFGWRTTGGTIAIALLAVASSVVSIVNDFTYDDVYVIAKNPLMRDGAWWRVLTSSYWPRDWGGDGYRPLTILAFKIEYFIGGGHPVVFHAVNIALYAVVSVLVLGLARRLFPPERQWAAWLTAALFAVHPVHVEAVANVVGQSELLVAIGLVLATSLYIRDRMVGPLQRKTAVAITALYAASLCAKEHAVVLPGLLAAVEIILIHESTPWRARIARMRPFYLVLALVAVAFVAGRALVLFEHPIGGFQPFTPFNTLHISNRDRVLTAIGIVPDWVRLLYWPIHLSSEYGPPDIEIAQGFSVSQLPGLLLLAGLIALGVVLRRRQPIISFGLAFGIIALLPSSNFILPAGIALAERTLFLPSVGAMLIAGAVAAVIADHARARFGDQPALERAGQALVLIILIAGALRSGFRSTVWHDNERLFRQAVIDSPMAYRAHYMLGAWAFDNQRKREGEVHYREALKLFPYDPYLSFNLAEQYRKIGLCAPAIPLYEWSLGLDKKFPSGRSALARCLLTQGRYAEARARALDALSAGAKVEDMRPVIHAADSAATAESQNAVTKPTRPLENSGKLPGTVQKPAK